MINGNLFDVDVSDATHIIMSLTKLEDKRKEISRKLHKEIDSSTKVLSTSYPLSSDYFRIDKSFYWVILDSERMPVSGYFIQSKK